MTRRCRNALAAARSNWRPSPRTNPGPFNHLSRRDWLPGVGACLLPAVETDVPPELRGKVAGDNAPESRLSAELVRFEVSTVLRHWKI